MKGKISAIKTRRRDYKCGLLTVIMRPLYTGQRYLKFKRISPQRRRGRREYELYISAERAKIYKTDASQVLGIDVICFPASHRKTKLY
jgi:hypothetical protein